jgi:histidyl-tRNA synthetase
MLFKSPRGTKDILPQESRIWREVEEKARAVFSLFAYEEIRTPIIEESKLFSRSLGDLTDIVQKQMFLIKKETDTFVLRPEATASIVRSYVEHTLYNVVAVSKFFYLGPMFRAERPQKGRLRQFHHIGGEAIGSYHPHVDAESLACATRLIASFGISGFQVVLNTLGCLNDKKSFALNLREKILPHKKSFCEDCQARMAKNIFRVLDCKNKQCRDIIVSQNLGRAHICPDCEKHFKEVKEGLDLLGVPYQVDPFLVRGLDYYTRTVFEITHAGLGSQDALGAGGRYDSLVEELGGPARGAFGFALGFERLLLAMGRTEDIEGPASCDCYIIPLGEEASKMCLKMSQELRESRIRVDVDFLEGSLKSKMRRSDKSRARFALIIGDDELAKGAGVLKDMRNGAQEDVALGQLGEKIKSLIL